MQIKKLVRYREILMYLVFGGLTTLVSAIFYFAASWGVGLSAWLSSIISWVFAVIFAFFTNRIFVFRSSAGRPLYEACLFFAARISSLGIGVGIMFVFVDMLNLHEPLIFVIAQGIVIIFNYVVSKYIIFGKKGK